MGACDEDKFANETERPRRPVEIVQPLEIGIFPVTVGEWVVFDPNHDQAANDLPVVNVSHRDIARYLAWLNESQTGRPWRLPTEEEWEYACRAGTETIFNTGDQLDRAEANFLFDESIERVGPGCRTAVVTYPPNPWGLHDLHGNVAEWTASDVADLEAMCWTERRENPLCTNTGTQLRNHRGGAYDAVMMSELRNTMRGGLFADQSAPTVGFRCARTR